MAVPRANEAVRPPDHSLTIPVPHPITQDALGLVRVPCFPQTGDFFSRYRACQHPSVAGVHGVHTPHAPTPLGLASVGPLCARVARAIEGGKLNASPEGLARTLPPQQTPILGEHSSPIMRYCRQSRTAAILASKNH